MRKTVEDLDGVCAALGIDRKGRSVEELLRDPTTKRALTRCLCAGNPLAPVVGRLLDADPRTGRLHRPAPQGVGGAR